MTIDTAIKYCVGACCIAVLPFMLAAFTVGFVLSAIVGAFRTGYGDNTFASAIAIADGTATWRSVGQDAAS